MTFIEDKITQTDTNNTNKNNGIRALLPIRYKTGFTLNSCIFVCDYFYKKTLLRIIPK